MSQGRRSGVRLKSRAYRTTVRPFLDPREDDSMNEAQRYRQRAEQCYLRAQTISYRSVAELLKSLGDECMEKARALEGAEQNSAGGAAPH
jgi:hypothetical protein